MLARPSKRHRSDRLVDSLIGSHSKKSHDLCCLGISQPVLPCDQHSSNQLLDTALKKAPIKSRISFLALQHCQQNRRLACPPACLPACLPASLQSNSALQTSAHILCSQQQISDASPSLRQEKKKKRKFASAPDRLSVGCSLSGIIVNPLMHLTASASGAAFLAPSIACSPTAR